jgi:DUF917 family protein
MTTCDCGSTDVLVKTSADQGDCESLGCPTEEHHVHAFQDDPAVCLSCYADLIVYVDPFTHGLLFGTTEAKRGDPVWVPAVPSLTKLLTPG